MKNCIDIKYEDFISSPEKEANRIYKVIDVNNIPTIELQEVLLNNTKYKYGIHKYMPEDFGLSTGKITNRLAPFYNDKLT